MKKLWLGALSLSAALLWVAVAVSQPPGDNGVEDSASGPPGDDVEEPSDPRPEGPPVGPRRRGFDGPPRGPYGGPPGRPPHPPGPFELGRVIPPHICDELDLSTEQQEELDKIEQDVKEKLNKLLTDEQKERLASIAPPPRPGPGHHPGPGGPPGAQRGGRPGRPPARRNGPPGPPPREGGPRDEAPSDF